MTVDPQQIRLERGASGGRYVYDFGDGIEAELAYSERRPGIVTITHTETPPIHRGRGIAAALVKRAVEDFRAADVKVVPACWYARRLFDAHPDWADLLHKE